MEHKRSNKTKTAPAQNIQPGAPPIMRPQSRPAPSISAPTQAKRCATLRTGRFTSFLRANSRPEKRPYRTVLRAWLLSRQEQKNGDSWGAAAAKNASQPGIEQAPKTQLAVNAPQSGQGKAGFIAQTRANEQAAESRLSFGPDWAGLGRGRTQPALPFVRSEIRSKFRAPKTPPSHGLTGLAAIKAIAK